MKNVYTLGQRVSGILFAIFCLTFGSYAQVLQVTETPPTDLNVCMGGYAFSVTVRNTSGTVTASNIKLFYDMPNGMIYSGGLGNATYFGSNPPDQPIFALADLAPNTSITVTFNASADCSLFALASSNTKIKNVLNIGYTETPGTAKYQLVNTSSYNLFSANLSISVTNQTSSSTDPFSSANLGMSFTKIGFNPNYRQITIDNLGGSTDTVLIHIKAENEIQYFGFTARNLMPLSDWWFDAAAQEYVLRLTGMDIGRCEGSPGSNPNVFEDKETLIIYEDFDAVACSTTPDANTDYFVEWGCNGALCQNSTNQHTSANIHVNAGSPVLEPALDGGYPVASYCRDGDTIAFKFTNTATGFGNFASDLVLEIQSYEASVVLPSFGLYNFQINGKSVPLALVQEVFNMQTIGNPSSAATHGYRIDLSGNTLAGLAQDLDFDGFYDDLGAGLVLHLTAQLHFDHPQRFESVCPTNYYILAGRPQARYKASCSDVVREAGNAPNQYYDYYVRPNGAFNGDIIGTSDMVENVPENFRFCTGSFQTSEGFFECPVDSFFVKIFLPDGYDLAGAAKFTSVTGMIEKLTPVQNGDVITIPYDGDEGWQGCYSLPLVLSCTSVAGVLTGTSELSWELDYKCDTCDVLQRRVCDSKTIYNHASCNTDVAGCSGVATMGFDVNRRTFGWTDYTFTQRADENTPGVELNAAYPYDTVQSTTNGRVVGSSFGKVFCEVRYSAPEMLLDWLGGRVEVFDLSGNSVGSCAISSAPILNTSAGPEYSYLFEAPASCMALMDSGYTVKFYNDWQVKNTNTLANGKVFYFNMFRSSIRYGIDESSLQRCDEWGTNFALYGVNSYPFPIVLHSENCKPYTINLYEYNLGGIAGDDFPNEIRSIIDLNDTITIYIPEGSSYINGSAFTMQIDGYDNVSKLCNCQQIPINPVYADAEKLVFVYDWQKLDKYNQDIDNKEFLPFLSVQFQPECDRNDTTFTLIEYGYNNYAYTENAAYYEPKTWTDDVRSKFSDSTNVYLSNYLPNLTVSTGTYMVDAYTNKVEWSVQVCNKVSGNLPRVTDAKYTWFDVDNYATNTGNIVIDRVYETPLGTNQLVTTYSESPAENSLVELGTIAANTCRNFILEGSFVNCASRNDSLHLMLGWNCTAYPDPIDAETASCQLKENLLGVRYKTANMNTTVTAPTGTIEVCDTLHYEVLLESTAPAYMYDVKYWTNLPAGASIVNADYLYTISNTVWNPLDLTNTAFSGANPVGWELSSIIPEWLKHDGGFVGTKEPDSSKILLRFDVALSCDFNPTDSIVFNSFGVTNCQDTLQFSQVKHFDVEGFTKLDKLRVSMYLPDTAQCSETVQINITVKNLNGIPNQFEDSLQIEIPNELGVLMALPFNAVMQMDAVKTTVKWAIPALTINGYDSLNYTLFLLGVPVVSCTEIPIPATVYYVGTSQCGQLSCNPTAVIDVADSSLLLCCNPCSIVAEWEADTVCYSTCCGGADTMCFRLTDQNTIGADYAHNWSFGDGTGSIDAEPCHVYDAVGAYYVCHTVTQFSTGCFETHCDSVYVIDKPTGAIELLGCNPFCEGDTVYLTVNGTYHDISWVSLPSGTIIGTGDTLTVTTGGRYNAILSNGICTSECLAIDLVTQIPPEIEIPDTAFCAGDSILVCATSGFTSYEWRYEGTIINSSASCIWISKAGEYTVSVGEKLPFGCCTCKGIDTFTVIINPIKVTVPDLTICENTSGTLCASVTGGYAPYSYEWQPTGEVTSCISVTTAGNYIATATDAMGCVASDTGKVILEGLPDAEFNHDTICLNAEYCFVPVETAGSHHWEIADSTGTVLTTSTNVTFCYQFPFTGKFDVKHILTNACGADTVIHEIVVVEPAEACIVLTGQNPFCEGDTVCLSVNDPFNRVQQVEWFLNDVSVYIGDVYCVTVGGTYRARVTDKYGCVSECICIVLTTIPAPVLTLPDKVRICSGQINAVLDAGSGHSEYIWYYNNSFYAFGVSSITVTQAGTYRVEVTGTNGCKAIDSTVVSLSIEIVIIGSTRQSVCRNESFTVFTAENPDYTYQWYMASNASDLGVPVPGSDTSRLQLTGNQLLGANTWFNVVVTDNSTGCQYKGKIRIIHKTVNCNEMSLMPNPVTGTTLSVIYDLLDAQVQVAQLQFRNELGAVVANFEIDTALQEAILDVSNLANGVYQVGLWADGELIDTQRLLITR